MAGSLRMPAIKEQVVSVRHRFCTIHHGDDRALVVQLRVYETAQDTPHIDEHKVCVAAETGELILGKTVGPCSFREHLNLVAEVVLHQCPFRNNAGAERQRGERSVVRSHEEPSRSRHDSVETVHMRGHQTEQKQIFVSHKWLKNCRVHWFLLVAVK